MSQNCSSATGSSSHSDLYGDVREESSSVSFQHFKMNGNNKSLYDHFEGFGGVIQYNKFGCINSEPLLLLTMK